MKHDADAAEYGRIPHACKKFGFSRSGIYRLASEGKLRLIKLHNATLVDYASARKLLGEAPTV